MLYFKTKDLPRAAFLVVKGFKCIGAVPDETDPKGFRKLFAIEYDESEDDLIHNLEAQFLNGDDEVSAIAFYRAQKIIKRYITDLE